RAATTSNATVAEATSGPNIATRVTRAGLAVLGAVPPKIITDTGNPLWTAPRCLRYSLGRAVTLRVESGARARVEAHRRPPGRGSQVAAAVSHTERSLVTVKHGGSAAG